MNGEAMQEEDSRKPAARRPSINVSLCNNASSSLDFSDTVERILSTLEQRGDDHDPAHGPLTRAELSKLSLLCAQQQQLFSGTTSKPRTTGSASKADSILDEDLGFADVDADMIGQLVEYLEKHVALASVVNIVQASYNAIQSLRSGSGQVTTMLQVSSAMKENAAEMHIIVKPDSIFSMTRYFCSGSMKLGQSCRTFLLQVWKRLPSFFSLSLARGSIVAWSTKTPLLPLWSS